MLERCPLGATTRRILLVALALLATTPGATLAQRTGPPGIDTLFARAADEVVSALASALSQRDLMAGLSPESLVSTLQDAMRETRSAVVRTASQLVDSAGLAALVDPVAARYIGPSGGRYVLDVIVTEQVAGQTRVRVTPLLIAMVPGSDSPLGGRPLPSAGVVERQTLATIAADLPGGAGGGP
jgi:hypothetical protein